MSTAQQAKELYNSFLIDPYIQLINKRYPHVDINEVLSYAEIMPWEAATLGLAAAVLVGLIAGVAPARRAAALDSVTTLRE